jgi:hypothetical protein
MDEAAEPEDIVDLDSLMERWGAEYAIEQELAGLGTPADATWVPLAEAERQAGVSRSTLRTWYRTGQIASRLMPGPHGLQRLVPLEVVQDRAARSPRTGPRSAPAPAKEDAPMTSGLSTPDAVVRLAELATAAATERAEAAEARADAAEAALRAALERAAAAEAEVRLLRQKD